MSDPFWERLLDSTHPDRKSSWATLAKSTVVVTVAGYTTFTLVQLVRAYGWEGTLRYIWEGDPYPAVVRTHFETLDQVQIKSNNKANAISTLEEALERAKLDSIENASASSIVKLWKSNVPVKYQDLRKSLALMSYDLDQLAATIDQVPTSFSEASGEKAVQQIRNRKKNLSNSIVKLMERTDKLITFFKTAEEH